MANVNQAIHEFKKIDQLSQRDLWVNRLHPLGKLVVTILFIVLTVSFSKYDLIGILPMGLYLFLGFEIAELSIKDALYRLRVILPIVCIMGIFNPIFDTTMITFAGITMRAGILSMLTLMIKGIYAVLASYLLIATTSIEMICYALRLVHIPNLLVTEILLIYRYISVLLEEVHRLTDAYKLRAPNQKGIHYKAWGPLAGQLLLRSIDRANNVYDSMTLRGYTGDFRYIGAKYKARPSDFLVVIICAFIFVLFRRYTVLIYIGNFILRITT